jgi:hypothetical protein
LRVKGTISFLKPKGVVYLLPPELELLREDEPELELELLDEEPPE